jgi:cobalt-zinc-cadmium efflux system outer membrane protein
MLTISSLKIATLALVIALSSTAYAQELSYLDAAKQMLESNPDLSNLRAQEESLKYKSVQAIAPNEPEFTYSKTDLATPNIFKDGGATVFGVNWTLGFPGKAWAQRKQLRHQADSLQELSYQRELELLTTLSSVYVELSVNQNTMQTLKEELKRAQQTVILTEKRYSSAQAAQTDILNAKFYQASVDQDILAQEASRDALLIQFRALLRKPEEQSLTPKLSNDWVATTLDKPFADLKNVMFGTRPQLKSVVATKEAANAALTGALLAPLPDFQLSLAYNDYHIDSAAPVIGLNRSYSVGVGISIPIFFPFNELSGIKSARMDLQAAEFAEESARISVISDLQNLYTHFESAKRLLQSTEDFVVPAAKANYTLTLKTFEAGKLDYLKLLDARKNWIQSQRDLLDHQKELAETISQIVLEVGCDWTREGVPHACK